MGSLPKGDSQALMDFVIEASGASDAISDMKKKNRQEEEEREMHVRRPDGQPLSFSKVSLP